jgi:hypothetical protein
MAAVRLERTRAGFGGQLPTSWRCGLMTETGRAPILAPSAGERIPALPLRRQWGRGGSNPAPAGPRPAMLPFTPRLPFRRCQWGLHPPVSPYQDAASLPRPWHHEAGGEIRTPMGPLTGRVLILVEPHRHVYDKVVGVRQKRGPKVKTLVGYSYKRPMMSRASDPARFSSVTASG